MKKTAYILCSFAQEKKACDSDLGKHVEDWEDGIGLEDNTGNSAYIGRFYYDCKQTT